MSTATSLDWNSPARYLPADGEEVDAMDSGGHVQRLILKDGLWWFPDFSMHVYYVPTFWREVTE